MAPSKPSPAIRVALIDDDSGLLTVLERRFAALGWDYEVLGYAPGPDQLAAMRLHALIVNPALTGLDYIERIGMATARAGAARDLPGRRRSPTASAGCEAAPTTG